MVCLQKDSYLVPRLELNGALAWNTTHLFSGAFGGWSQAFHWLERNERLILIDREIFVDNDEQMMEIWNQNNESPYVRLPLTKVKVWDAEKKLGVLGDIKNRSIMLSIDARTNHIATVSPPCITWSTGGKGSGLSHEHGWAFIEAIIQCFFMQRDIICFECADAFKKHKHSELVEKLLTLLGFRCVWEQVCPYHQLGDCFRTP